MINLKDLFIRSTWRITELQEQINYRVSYSTLMKRVVKGYYVSPATVRIVLDAFNRKLGTDYTEDDVEFLLPPGEEDAEEDEEASIVYQDIA